MTRRTKRCKILINQDFWSRAIYYFITASLIVRLFITFIRGPKAAIYIKGCVCVCIVNLVLCVYYAYAACLLYEKQTIVCESKSVCGPHIICANKHMSHDKSSLGTAVEYYNNLFPTHERRVRPINPYKIMTSQNIIIRF